MLKFSCSIRKAYVSLGANKRNDFIRLRNQSRNHSLYNPLP